MGWWKINSEARGQIDFDTDLNSSPVRSALPGSTPEFYYNGDGPADIVGDAFFHVEEILAPVGVKPNPSQLQELLLERNLESLGSLSDRAKVEIARVVQESRDSVANEYQKAWGRPPYDGEWQAVVSFVLGPCDP